MRQALIPKGRNSCEDEQLLVTKIDSEARGMMQVFVTEFICFITGDIIEEISKEKRVAIKE